MNMTKISAMALDEYTKEQLLAQFPDINDWDGVYHDSELTGLDSGYPPGSDGAHAWEKINPGKKVVDVLFRDETDPEYAPDDDMKETTESMQTIEDGKQSINKTPITSNKELASLILEGKENENDLYLRRAMGWEEGDEDVPFYVAEYGMKLGKDSMNIMEADKWFEMIGEK